MTTVYTIPKYVIRSLWLSMVIATSIILSLALWTPVKAQGPADGTIVGTVTDENSNDPLGNILVEVFIYDGPDRLFLTSTVTSPAGGYQITVPPGLYAVGFTPMSGTYVPEYFNDQPDVVSATPISVTTGFTTTIDAALAVNIPTPTPTLPSSPLPTPTPIPDSFEPDDNSSKARPIIPGITQTHSIIPVGDVDWVTFTLTDSSNIVLETSGNGDNDTRLYLYDSSVSQINFDDDGGTDRYSRIETACNPAGTYYAAVDEYLNDDVIDSYTLTLSTATCGTIAGTVTDASNNPLSNIYVQVFTYNSNGQYWDYVDFSYTDANGQYQFELPAGTYRVGFFDWNTYTYFTEYYDDQPDVESATDITVTSGTTTNINEDLSRGGTIAGTVTDEGTNTPLADVFVDAYVYDGQFWNYVKNDLTDANGEYEISGLISGTYRIEFRQWENLWVTEYYDNQPDFSSATDIVLGNDETLNNIDAALAVNLPTPTPTLPNSPLPTPTNTPTSTVTLTPTATTTPILTPTATTTPILTPTATATPIPSPTSTPTSTPTAPPNSTASISGQVTDVNTNAPVAGIEVCAQPVGTGLWGGCTSTANDGTYQVSNLSENVYRVRFRDPAGVYGSEYFNDSQSYQQATLIPVSERQAVANIDAALRASARITGQVTNADGELLEGINVDAYQLNGNWWQWAGSDTTDATGNYTIGNLDQGTYRVEFRDWSGTYQSEAYDDAANLDAGTDVVVASDSALVTSIDAVLETSGRIAGQVLDSAGQPIEDIFVDIYRVNSTGSNTGPFNTNWSWTGWGQTDANGEFDIGGLRAGDYRVGFFDWYNQQYFTQYYNGADSLENGTDVNVASGQIATISATLAEGGKISGQVTASDDSPLPGINVEALRYDGNQWVSTGWATSQTDGSYEVEGLATGTYRVRFAGNATYAYEYYNDVDNLDDATDINVVQEQTTANIDAKLEDHAPPAATVNTGSGSVQVDAATGELTISQRNGNRSDVTITKSGACDDGSTATDMQLTMGNNTYAMTETAPGSGLFQATIPSSDLEDSLPLQVTRTCPNGGSENEDLGQVVLYDPSGYITDAQTGQPVVGATITLHKVPGWRAQIGSGDVAVNTCQSNLSKLATDPWNQPAPTTEGVVAAPLPTEMDPTINPQTTDNEGYYGWDVAAGCWYVVVEAEGYVTLTSPVVGVPPEVTDLDLFLVPTDRTSGVYLPIIQR